MKNHTTHLRTETAAAAVGLVLAVAVDFAVFLVVGGGVGPGGRRRGQS